MLVSVLITCFNCEKYIRKAIMSVILQIGEFDIEILVGDDGSSDATQKIVYELIKKYPDRIRLYITQRDELCKSSVRAAHNRLHLLQKASGDYIAYLDGDDAYICNTKIQEQIDVLENPKNAGCSCCGHDTKMYMLDTGKSKNMMDKSIKEGIIPGKMYWRKYYIHTNTILFRGSAVDDLRNCRFSDQFNDNLITYLLLQRGDIYYIPKAMARYNITGDGIWTGKSKLYGYVRNLITYDAELVINREYENASFHRHLSDINHLIQNQSTINKCELDALLQFISPQTTPTVYLFVYYDQLTDEQIRIRQKLVRRAMRSTILLRITRIPIYFTKLLRKKRKSLDIE